MKRVNQKESNPGTGDCMRASIASVLELDIEAVPHLARTKIDKWFSVMYYFFIAYGFLYEGRWYRHHSRRKLLKKHSINGYYLATVKSRASPDMGVTHMVVMNSKWKVVHDPSPSKSWQGEDLKTNPDLVSIYMFRKMNSTDLGYWGFVSLN